MANEIQKLRTLGRAIAQSKDRIEIPALSEFLGSYLNRIFKRGLSSDGRRIGIYVSNWAKTRQKRGRQIAYKDLFFTGELRNSIQIGKSSNDNVIGFVNDTARKISEGQQGQTGKDIFTATETELKRLDKAIVKNLDREIKRHLL